MVIFFLILLCMVKSPHDVFNLEKSFCLGGYVFTSGRGWVGGWECWCVGCVMTPPEMFLQDEMSAQAKCLKC